MKYSHLLFFYAMALLFAVVLVPANASDIDGRGIAQLVFDRDTGADSHAKIRMLLVDKKGYKKHRSLVMAKKKYEDLKKIYIRFDSPADIDGTAFLTWENRGRDDDQFLFLPSLRRVRRIVSSQKESRFVNTDFTYEDMQLREVPEDSHRLLREEKWSGFDCWVIESEPVDSGSTQYGKRVSWIVKDALVPIKTEYFDKRGTGIVKIYKAARLERIDGIWTPMEYEMHDLKQDHRTLMKITEIRYNQGVEDRMFTETYLQYEK